MESNIDNSSNEYILNEIASIQKLCNLIENYKVGNSNQSSNSKINSNKKVLRGKNLSQDFDYSSRYEKSKQEIKDLDTPIKKNKSTSVESTITERLKHYKMKKDNRYMELKRKFKDEEDQKYKPTEMANHSKTIVSSFKDSFLTRVEKNIKTEERKKKQFSDFIKRDREEKDKKILEEKEALNVYQEKYSKKLKNDYIQAKINNMIDWGTQKQKSIEMKEKKLMAQNCPFKPEINEVSSKITNLKNKFAKKEDIVDRLYSKDIAKRKQKKEILEDVYAPTFVPVINHNSKKGCSSNYETYTSNFPEKGNINFINFDYKTNSNDNELIEEILRERTKLARNRKDIKE